MVKKREGTKKDFFIMAQQPPVGQVLLIFEDS
jgi:hypothetical protein